VNLRSTIKLTIRIEEKDQMMVTDKIEEVKSFAITVKKKGI
jgi:hypothetical protein